MSMCCLEIAHTLVCALLRHTAGSFSPFGVWRREKHKADCVAQCKRAASQVFEARTKHDFHCHRTHTILTKLSCFCSRHPSCQDSSHACPSSPYLAHAAVPKYSRWFAEHMHALLTTCANPMRPPLWTHVINCSPNPSQQPRIRNFPFPKMCSTALCSVQLCP